MPWAGIYPSLPLLHTLKEEEVFKINEGGISGLGEKTLFGKNNTACPQASRVR